MAESMEGISVPRGALGSSDTDSRRSSPTDAALEARFREQFRALYHTTELHVPSVEGHVAVDDIGIIPSGNGANDDGDGHDDAAEGYEFRLFSGSNAKQAAPADGAIQRIAIRSPTPVHADPGFVVPRRPDSYYFARPLDAVRAEQIAAAAISGEQVIDGLKIKWRGCELPWRVTVIRTGQSKSTSTSLDRVGAVGQPSASNKRKRMGKKRRIAIRKKARAVQEKTIASKRSQAEREAADREKRTRKNREKKVKKKQKEKMQKMKDVEDIMAAG